MPAQRLRGALSIRWESGGWGGVGWGGMFYMGYQSWAFAVGALGVYQTRARPYSPLFWGRGGAWGGVSDPWGGVWVGGARVIEGTRGRRHESSKGPGWEYGMEYQPRA